MKTLSNNLRLFWQGALLSYIALFHWMRPIQYMASKIIMPLAQMFFFVYLGTFATGERNAAFYIVGNALQIAAVSGIYGMTMSIGGDRDSGTLGYILGTPANRFVVFMGRAFMNILDGALGVVIAFTWGVVLMGLDLSHTNIFALALTIIITISPVDLLRCKRAARSSSNLGAGHLFRASTHARDFGSALAYSGREPHRSNASATGRTRCRFDIHLVGLFAFCGLRGRS